MSSYKELLSQRAALDAQIERARQAEMHEAVRQVRELVTEYSLSVADVFGGAAATGAPRSAGRARRGAVAPKYRNPATGQTWSGRGKPPKWIEGKERTGFLIG